MQREGKLDVLLPGALAALGRLFLLSHNAGWLIVLTTACLSEDAVLLYFSVESLEETLEGFIGCESYFNHDSHPLSHWHLGTKNP
jgi:hypothetical protein